MTHLDRSADRGPCGKQERARVHAGEAVRELKWQLPVLVLKQLRGLTYRLNGKEYFWWLQLIDLNKGETHKEGLLQLHCG